MRLDVPSRSRRVASALALASVVALLLSACGPAPTSTESTAAPDQAQARAKSAWTTLGARNRVTEANHVISAKGRAEWVDYDPPALFSGAGVTQANIMLTMDDGVVLSLNVTRPTGADGQPSAEPLPTLLTFTPYNKNV